MTHLELARLCEWVYKPGKHIHTVGNVQWATALDPDTGATVVVFRGTDGVEDLVSDLLAFKVPFATFGGRCRTHWGFWLAWNKVRKLINAIPGELIITGHSFGAALAMHAAIENSQRVREVCLFGCPRIGNHAFADRYDTLLGERTTRISNGLDPVSYYPLGVQLWPWPPTIRGWRHGGRLQLWHGAKWHDHLPFLALLKLLLCGRWRLLRLHPIRKYCELPYPPRQVLPQ